MLSDGSGAQPAVDFSALDNRELRRTIRPGGDTATLTVADCVPFFLEPNPLLWERWCSGLPALQLNPPSLVGPAADFVMLVSTVRAAGENAVVADGDAAEPSTRFFRLADSEGRMPRRLSEEEDLVREAELLVPVEFDFGAVTLVGVANDRVRSEMRSLLEEHGLSHKVSVYPPWFQPS